MKVIKWISYDEAENYTSNSFVGGLGGFFENGMRWKDYEDGYTPEALQFIAALRKEILEKSLKISGEQHQYKENCAPLFEDGTVALYSYRAWGDLMAAIWSEEENKDYSYFDFYMFAR